MSANLKAKVLTVVLDGEYRDGSLERIMDAIRLTRGVSKVTAAKVEDPGQHFAEDAARREVRDKIMEILYPKDR